MPTINPPDLRVIDRAIEKLIAGKIYFSCVALWEAWAELNGMSREQLYAEKTMPADALEYSKQFRNFCRSRNDHADPKWWNGPQSFGNFQERLQALHAFKIACIAAGKKAQ